MKHFLYKPRRGDYKTTLNCVTEAKKEPVNWTVDLCCNLALFVVEVTTE